jgi:hypothetical protein
MPGLPGAGLTRMFDEMGTYAKPDDIAEFDRRVGEHLSKCRKRLVENVARKIIHSRENKLQFAVANETEDAIEGVQLVVSLPRVGVDAFVGAPAVKQIPSLPAWPSFGDDMISGAAMTQALCEQYDPDFVLAGHGHVTRHRDTIEIEFDIGSLRPGETHPTRAVTMIVGEKAPHELPVTMTVRAMSTKGNKTVEKTLAVSAEMWELGDWVDSG